MPSKVRKILKKAKKVIRGKKKPAKKTTAKKNTRKKTAKKTARKKTAKKKVVKRKTTKKKAAKKKTAKKSTKKKTTKKSKKKTVKKKVVKRKTTKKKAAKKKPTKKAPKKKAAKKVTKKAAAKPVKKVAKKTVEEEKKPVKKKRIPLKYERPAKLRDLRIKRSVKTEWDANRSKIKAALENGLPEGYFTVQHMLYIGAAHGYTISHMHDKPVHLFAVEKSGEMIRHFLPLAENLPNVLPIFGDAANPDGYAHMLPRNVDVLFQDIAQKDQVGIFLANCNRFLSHQGVGMLALKAQNIDSMAEPASVFADSKQKLEEGGATIVQEINLEPYHKDHRLYVVHLNPIYEW